MDSAGSSEFDSALAAAREDLERSTNGALSRPARCRIYASFGPAGNRRDSSGKPAGVEFTQGLRRRYRLAELSAQKVLPIWDALIGSQDPAEMLQVGRDYLGGKMTWEDAWKRKNSFSGGLRNATSLERSKFCAVYAGWASVSVVGLAMTDEYMGDPELDDSDLDWEQWDAAYFAAAAYAKDAPLGEDCDKARLREFWDWYLHSAVPLAYTSPA